jgi:hypothetical protein
MTSRALRTLTIPLLAVLLAACQPDNTDRPVPSVNQIGSDLKCLSGDHGYADPAGWGFCYPADWKYTLRAQPSQDLRGLQELDVTFDITSVPTVNGSPLPACPSPAPPPQTPAVCSSTAGLFAYMIVSTYQRAGAPDLASWLQHDVSPVRQGTSIAWGNAVEAVRLDDGRRVALTPTQVIVLDLRSGAGNLDLEAAMSSRLDKWKFYY